jgi:hypothetical protein
MGWGSFKSRWVQVVESHKSGWPHVNLMIHNAGLAKYLADEQAARKANGQSELASRLLSEELLGHAIESGWGQRSTAEAVKNREAMAGYLTKLASQAHEHIGELAKITQAPTNAPHKFRRLRSGKGFLPRAGRYCKCEKFEAKDPEGHCAKCGRKQSRWTGGLVRRYYDPEWGYVAQAFRGKKKPTPHERNQHLIEIETIEGREFVDELVSESRERASSGRWGTDHEHALPPISHWKGGTLQPLEKDGQGLLAKCPDRRERARLFPNLPNNLPKRSDLFGFGKTNVDLRNVG